MDYNASNHAITTARVVTDTVVLMNGSHYAVCYCLCSGVSNLNSGGVSHDVLGNPVVLILFFF